MFPATSPRCHINVISLGITTSDYTEHSHRAYRRLYIYFLLTRAQVTSLASQPSKHFVKYTWQYLNFAYLVSQPRSGLLRFQVWYLARPSGCCTLPLNHWERQRRRVSKEIAWITKTRALGNLQLEATEPQGWTFFLKKKKKRFTVCVQTGNRHFGARPSDLCNFASYKATADNQSSAGFSLFRRNLMHICSPITLRKTWHFLACHWFYIPV